MSGAAEAVNAVTRSGPVTSMLPDPTQLELLRAPDGSLPRASIANVRGRGRPKNARNKRSKRVADYFVAKYGDPLDVLGNLMNTPLRQLVEVLIEAEGGEEREARLLDAVEDAAAAVKKLSNRNWAGDVDTSREQADKLSEAIDKLADVAKSLSSGKPGKLALDALTVQLQATFRALEYVHGKQPISIDVATKADLVVFAPEILKQHGIDEGELRTAIAERGLEAFDADAMRLVAPEDAEFSEVPGENGDSE